MVKRRFELLAAALVAMLMFATLAMAAFATTQETQCATVGSELTAATSTATAYTGSTPLPAETTCVDYTKIAITMTAMNYAYADGDAKEARLTATCEKPNEGTMCAVSYDRAAGAKIDATSSLNDYAAFSTTAGALDARVHLATSTAPTNYYGATTTIATGYKGIDNLRT